MQVIRPRRANLSGNGHGHGHSVADSKLWNSLPLNCRTAPSVNTFKIRLKTFSLIRHNRTVARASVLRRDIN